MFESLSRNIYIYCKKNNVQLKMFFERLSTIFQHFIGSKEKAMIRKEKTN